MSKFLLEKKYKWHDIGDLKYFVVVYIAFTENNVQTFYWNIEDMSK